MTAIDYSGSVGTTAVRLIEKNPLRRGMGLYNLSSNVIYLGYLPTVSAVKGLVGIAGGAFFEMDLTNLWDGDIWVIASGAGTTFLCEEISQ